MNESINNVAFGDEVESLMKTDAKVKNGVAWREAGASSVATPVGAPIG